MMDDGPLFTHRSVIISGDESLDNAIFEYFALDVIYQYVCSDLLGRILNKRRMDLISTIRSREDWFNRAVEYETRMT